MTELKQYTVDVLVVGEGIQALTLLHYLREGGYNAILVGREGRPLGGDTTLHSAGVIWNHVYRRMGAGRVAKVCKPAAEAWYSLCDDLEVTPPTSLVDLDPLPRHVPDEGGANELFLPSLTRLVQSLVSENPGAVLVGERAELKRDAGQFSLRVTVGGTEVTLSAEALVVAAGIAASGDVLRELQPSLAPPVVHSELYDSDKVAVVVATRGPTVPDRSIALKVDGVGAIVSLVRSSGEDELNVSLIGLEIRKADWDDPTEREKKLRRVIRAVGDRFEQSFRLDDWEYAIYQSTSWPRIDPPGYWIVRVVDVPPVFTVIPSRLTFAPVASIEMVEQLGGIRKSQRPPPRLQGVVSPAVGHDKWRTLEWKSYNEAIAI